MRTLYSSGSEWENKLGYSRAVQVGDTLYISATSAANDGVASGDLYEQTRFALEKLGEVFGDIRPALTLLHVLPFLDPAMLVEVELVAVRG